MSLARDGVQPANRPAHVVAALCYSGASAVAFVDCACGERVDSISAWYSHLRAEGQHPNLSDMGPRRDEPLRRLGITGRTLASPAAASRTLRVRRREPDTGGCPMNAFVVELVNKPGELAKLAEAIAHRGINITGLTGAASGSVCLMTNDEEGTRRALMDAYYMPIEIELVPVSLADKPGTLAEAARLLGDAGINIEAVFPTGTSGGNVRLAIATDDPAKARIVLGEVVLAAATG